MMTYATVLSLLLCSLLWSGTNAISPSERMRDMRQQALLFGGSHPLYGGLQGRRPNHLDVGLPQDLINSEDSLLIHLKDQGLWEKENAISGSSSKAALLPSYLKTLMMNRMAEEPPSHEDPEAEVVRYSGSHTHPLMLKSLLHHKFAANDLPDYEDLEQMLNDEEVEELMLASKMGGQYFDMKNAFKEMHEEQQKVEEQQISIKETTESSKDPGVYFNLRNLEAKLKQTLGSVSEDDTSETGQNQSNGNRLGKKEEGTFFNMIEILKSHIKKDDIIKGDEVSLNVVDDNSYSVANEVKKTLDSVNSVDKGPLDINVNSADTHSTDNEIAFSETQNDVTDHSTKEEFLKQLKTNKISVERVDDDGGLYFNLKNVADEETKKIN